MKSFLKYLLLTVLLSAISAGVIIANFQDCFPFVGLKMLWLIIPMTGIFMMMVVLNDALLVPQLLMKKRYVAYCASLILVSCATNLIGLLLEYSTRTHYDLPLRIQDYTSPWIIVDSLSNCVLLSMILLCLGIWQLYRKMNSETREESELTERLNQYMETVKGRLNPHQMLEKLNDITACLKTSADEASAKIRELCTSLRVQLYELPAPPQAIAKDTRSENLSRASVLLEDRKYKLVRHVLLIIAFLAISFGSFFEAPDRPSFTLDSFLATLFLFVVLSFLAYINILWLYPKFKVKGNIRKYVSSIILFLLLIMVPMIVVQALTYKQNVYLSGMPGIIVFLTTTSSLLTLMLFVGGISSGLILQDWIRTQRRMVLLRAETVKQEYAYLRKQINPHFLFNVLNNIGIIAYDDPEMSYELMEHLKSLLTYQFEDMRREYTSVGDEIDFLNDYLSLEESRIDGFSYRIERDSCAGNPKIPTLLFITFVENAVKYSPRPGGFVALRFRITDSRLLFECENMIDQERETNATHGGLGLTNIRRRLQLLYKNDYRLDYGKRGNEFIVKLEIPLI